MPLKRDPEPSLGDDRLDRIRADLHQFATHWGRSEYMTYTKNGFAVLEVLNEAIQAFARQQTSTGARQVVSGPSVEDTLPKLFAMAPRLEHFLGELDGDRSNVGYLDTISLRAHESMTFLKLCASFDEEVDEVRPVVATQTRLMLHPEGLRMCSPRPPKRSMFPDLKLSPAVAFNASKTITVGNEGVFMPPHIAHGSIGTLHTTSRGFKLFITWPPTDKNLGLMQPYCLRLERLADLQSALSLMRMLEKPRFNYLDAGDTMYVAAGHICATMAAYPIGEYQIQLANPAVDEWKDIKRAYNSELDAAINFLMDDGDIDKFEGAVQRFQQEHDLWTQVTRLPHTEETVERTAIEWFE